MQLQLLNAKKCLVHLCVMNHLMLIQSKGEHPTSSRAKWSWLCGVGPKCFVKKNNMFSGVDRMRCRGPDQTSSVVPRAECESWSEGHRRGGSWRIRQTRSRKLLSGRGESTGPDLPRSTVHASRSPPTPTPSTSLIHCTAHCPTAAAVDVCHVNNHTHTQTQNKEQRGVSFSQCVLFFKAHANIFALSCSQVAFFLNYTIHSRVCFAQLHPLVKPKILSKGNTQGRPPQLLSVRQIEGQVGHHLLTIVAMESFVVHRRLLELHGKTTLRHSPERLKQMGTCCKM